MDLTGVITALPTPFRGTGIDEDALAWLAGRQVACGVTALVVCGSTGEAATLSHHEAARVIACVAGAVGGHARIIAGCTAAATSAAAAMAAAAAHAGADALLLAAPPYVRATQDGIFVHVRAVAHAADLPVMLYDIPGRTGVAVADATVARLAAAELIFALKDATADLSRPPRLAALCAAAGARLPQFSGDDATAAGHLAMGGRGCVSVTANVAPALCVALHALWDAGDLQGFAACRDLLVPLHQALAAESNPIPLKAALAGLGLCRDELRLPMTRAAEATRRQLEAVLAKIVPEEERRATAPAFVAEGVAPVRSLFMRSVCRPPSRQQASRALAVTGGPERVL